MWQFGIDFADKQRSRVEKLTAWRSCGEIVDAVVATSIVDPASVIWVPRKSDPRGARRTECQVDADPDTVDAQFNSEHGDRAKFAASAEDGEAANRQIVDALVAKHLARIAGSDEDRHRSLHASRAKVWGIHDDRMDAGFKGPQASHDQNRALAVDPTTGPLRWGGQFVPCRASCGLDRTAPDHGDPAERAGRASRHSDPPTRGEGLAHRPPTLGSPATRAWREQRTGSLG